MRVPTLVTVVTVALAPVFSCTCEQDGLSAVTGALEGVACDGADGTPSPQAEVTVTAGSLTRTVRAGADGYFRVGDLPRGAAAVRVTNRSETHTVQVTVAAAAVTLVTDSACRGDPGLGGFGRVEGDICNRHTGDTVHDAQVTCVLAQGGSLTTTTDAAGHFALDHVPAGDQVCDVSSAGFSKSYLAVVRDGATTVVGGDDTCRAPGANEGFLHGSLCDPVGGGPLRDAAINTTDASGDEHTDVSDADGRWLLGPMPAGDVVVHVSRPPDVDLDLPARVVAGLDPDVPSPLTCGAPAAPGQVSGRVCAPDGSTYLSGAQVSTTLADGSSAETTTDADGRWTLANLPPGHYTVTITAGSFTSTVSVDVTENAGVALPESLCAIAQDIRIAVVEGLWDDVRSVLVDVGIQSSIITDYAEDYGDALLTNYAALAQYDIVFINCGVDDYVVLDSVVIQQNLRQFVQEGGSLYVSDQAYDIVEKTFPGKIEFFGNDADPQAAEMGLNADDIAGTIVDPVLAQAMGTSAIPLHYPLLGWAIMESVAADVRVYIRGDADVILGPHLSNIPHTVAFTQGSGKVIYSSFHQEPGIDVLQERVLQLLMFQL